MDQLHHDSHSLLLLCAVQVVPCSKVSRYLKLIVFDGANANFLIVNENSLNRQCAHRVHGKHWTSGTVGNCRIVLYTLAQTVPQIYHDV